LHWRLTVFLGYGPASTGLERNAKLLADMLRDMGISILYEEVRVPAIDFDGFEPFAKLDEEEVYIPSVAVKPEAMLDYILALRAANSGGLLPLPPLPPQNSTWKEASQIS